MVIDRVSDLFGQDLPEDLKAFYRERIDRVADFSSYIPTWNDWVGWPDGDEWIIEWREAGAVPLFSDGCGNSWALDLTAGDRTPAVYFFDAITDRGTPQYAAGSTLARFLLLLAEHDLAFHEDRPRGWEKRLDPEIDRCPRAPPEWLTSG